MGYPTKIATCCHCGTRAVLKLDAGRHQLSCSSCGAPLRDLKMLPTATPPAEERPAVSHRPPPRGFPAQKVPQGSKKPKKSKQKKRKHWLRGLAEEVFDVVEDIFD